MRHGWLVFAGVFLGCSSADFGTNEGVDSAAVEDTAAAEETSAPVDSGAEPDTSVDPDTGTEPDSAEPTETSVLDTGVLDSGGVDSGAVDSGVVDSGTMDSAPPVDTGTDTGCKKNACGGCATLPNEIGASCGVCSAGKYVCNGVDAVRCDDPFGGALPGASCGTCGTLKTACATDGRSAVCPGNDVNACGGCTTLTKAPGTKCGTCMTSSYACSGTEATACGKADDTTLSNHVLNPDAPNLIREMNTDRHCIVFRAPRAGTIAEIAVTLEIRVDSPTVATGRLAVRVIRGAPRSSPAPADVIATGSIAEPDGPVYGVIRTVTFASTAVLAAGEEAYVEFVDESPKFNWGLKGSSASVAAVQLAQITATEILFDSTWDPYFSVTMKGCP